ncbi:hypothetical protein VSX61_11070 [Brenneria populi subsp. brevivirga]|uniref:hypothetical protein n=1 Tax=Brenneria populi TaxID=1505588 RepID=UPI002E17598D|nr:hypothetical protein [Brenneria populi subsp. brevivirga]
MDAGDAVFVRRGGLSLPAVFRFVAGEAEKRRRGFLFGFDSPLANLNNQADNAFNDDYVAKDAVFFFNQPTAAKLPLRTLQPLVSIQTRLIRDDVFIRFSGLRAVSSARI